MEEDNCWRSFSNSILRLSPPPPLADLADPSVQATENPCCSSWFGMALAFSTNSCFLAIFLLLRSFSGDDNSGCESTI